MSPTRRDILAAIVAAPVAAVLPAATWIPNASAAPDIPPRADPFKEGIHFTGFSTWQDVGTETLLSGRVELYADQKKAIVRVANWDRTDKGTNLVFRHPVVVSALQIVMSAMNEAFDGERNLELIREDDVMCGDCLGVGWFKDVDGQPDCHACRGKGYGYHS
jgi:hypothetical protein